MHVGIPGSQFTTPTYILLFLEGGVFENLDNID